ncbi:hypothetical protein QYE76_028622 [Lolium multiflorum]|uniref:Uncharacterized protein n=1 Tax=Lolium multiflorum TaxID=4521 RepID=A0AAD8QPL6_LOLMU|nr:hypothetical protein QYE76_028622 [Lolium multiflorum]
MVWALASDSAFRLLILSARNPITESHDTEKFQSRRQSHLRDSEITSGTLPEGNHHPRTLHHHDRLRIDYLTLTRPGLQYAVQQVCLHMHAPHDSHWTAVKLILRYIRGTLGLRLSLHASTAVDIVAYSDADWAGYPDTRRSTDEEFSTVVVTIGRLPHRNLVQMLG